MQCQTWKKRGNRKSRNVSIGGRPVRRRSKKPFRRAAAAQCRFGFKRRLSFAIGFPCIPSPTLCQRDRTGASIRWPALAVSSFASCSSLLQLWIPSLFCFRLSIFLCVVPVATVVLPA
ncbi:hypothetical protein BKA81DRAFT_10606 [Phyllosticta paracitricarpa]